LISYTKRDAAKIAWSISFVPLAGNGSLNTRRPQRPPHCA